MTKMKNIDLIMFFLWVWGIVCGWLCSNWFADLRCEKKWEKWDSPKYEKGLLSLVWWYNRSREHLRIAGEKIIEIICGAIRDILPDIDGWVGSIDSSDVLFFSSNHQQEIWDNEVEAGGVEGWKSLEYLIEEIFPELKFRVDDDGIYLPPDKQKIIIERLQQLRYKDGK